MMYSEWASVQGDIQTDIQTSSVLHKFPDVVGKDVASAIVKSMAQNLSLSISNSEPSHLRTEKEVKWTMEVLCFGLTLPLTESDTLKDCVSVYCEWFSALTHPKNCVPRPVVDEPNPYIQDMLCHLHNVFVPRMDAVSDLVNKQAVLCHRVLRTVQTAAENSRIMNRDTWECLLKFLLGINNTLLAPPIQKDGIGDQLCERVVSVLFEMWILSCDRCFPTPPLWKTFREMCTNWRHHKALVVQWHRVNVAFTSKLLKFMYGPDYPVLPVCEDDQSLIPDSMDNHCIAQCWFRFLHILSNPVDLSRSLVIGNTPKFLHMALTSQDVVDPHQHECLRALPFIFQKAMRGISVLVDAFLGIYSYMNKVQLPEAVRIMQFLPGISDETPEKLFNADVSSTSSLSSHTFRLPSVHGTAGITPPSQRKTRAFTVGSQAKGSKSSLMSTPKAHHTSNSSSANTTPTTSPQPLTLESRPAFAPARPKVNSILHLFGAWLVEAAIVGVKVQGGEKTGLRRSVTKVLSKDVIGSPKSSAMSRSRTASFHLDPDTAHISSYPDGLDGAGGGGSTGSQDPGNPGVPVAATLTPSTSVVYEAGRAEACGTLCRIFCSHKTGEEILPVYLSRFYIVLYYGLRTDKTLNGTVLANIIFNSADLLRIDLDGIQILLPQLLKALELLLQDLAPRFKYDEQIAAVELRKASIHLLLSCLSLPLHFKELPIQSLFGDFKVNRDWSGTVTFLSLKKRMIELLIQALTVENDTTNTELLLGGLLLCVQDLALCEEAEASVHRVGEDMPPSPTPVSASIDTPHGLFGHAASLVCNRLMASWKLDLNIALAAMEVLSGLAKVKLSHPCPLMCKRTVNWICEFIVYQCSRPAPAHSKDLHSMLVAAFHCLTLWLVEHSYLMQDKESLHCVLEVVELGISGTKSQPDSSESSYGKDTPRPHGSKHKDKERRSTEHESRNRASDVPKLKGDKELKPVSLRVKEAAEGLLSVIMDHVGCFPPPCGPESVCSLLDEQSVLQHVSPGCSVPEQSTSTPFRYFVLDGTTVLALLEQPLGSDTEGLPTVTAVIRGPFGRHVWTMQLRHLPRNHKVESKVFLNEPARPSPLNDVGVHHNVKHRHFPEVVDHISLVQADKSIPKLEETMVSEQAELDKLASMIREQVQFENKVVQRVREQRVQTVYPDQNINCTQPKVCEEFQTARLFLSHYGFLSLEALKDKSSGSVPPSLVLLDPTEAGFVADLEHLDGMSCRIYDTVHVFYVKSGQKMPFEILSNVSEVGSVQPVFLELLRALGWPVDVKKHAGWTGNVATSWKIQPTTEEDEKYPANTGGSLYDGTQQVLYWADVASEVAFVVPSPRSYIPSTQRRTSDVTNDSLSELNNMKKYLVNPRRSLPTLTLQRLSNQKHTGGGISSQNASGGSGGHMVSPRTSTSGLPSLAAVNENGIDKSTEPTVKVSRPLDLVMTKPKSLSLDLDNKAMEKSSSGGSLRDSLVTPTDSVGRGGKRFGRTSLHATTQETKVFVVWLESFEDHCNFPAADLLASTSTGLPDNVPTSTTSLNKSGNSQQPSVSIIFIHALQNGLFRIHMQGISTKIHMGIPLVSGMVVSRRCLGTLVRQTTVNICRRKRLENDSYQPPHVRRKFKIKEMVDKYRNKLREPEFYTELFQNVAKS